MEQVPRSIQDPGWKPCPKPCSAILYDPTTASEEEEEYNERFDNKPENVTVSACNFYDATNEQFGRMESWAESDALGCRAGERGPSWCEDGSLDLGHEAARRNLDINVLQHFEAAWKAGKRFGKLSFVLRTGKHEKLEGTFKGIGETFGDWDAFKSFQASPTASTGVEDLECGDLLECGPDARKATLVRILKGTKAAGTAEEAKTQSCFVALLCGGDEWLYATLPNVENTFEEPDEAVMAVIESRLGDFVPKSVTAAIRAAGRFTIKKKSTGKQAITAPPAAASSSSSSRDAGSSSGATWKHVLAAPLPPKSKRARPGSSSHAVTEEWDGEESDGEESDGEESDEEESDGEESGGEEEDSDSSESSSH